MTHCFQSCFQSAKKKDKEKRKRQKKETQYEMFLRNNSLLTWLGNNYTNPLLEAGVFMTLRDSLEKRFLLQLLPLWGSTCFEFFSFFLLLFDYVIVRTSSKT